MDYTRIKKRNTKLLGFHNYSSEVCCIVLYPDSYPYFKTHFADNSTFGTVHLLTLILKRGSETNGSDPAPSVLRVYMP
jgi:hypothetical protein